MKYVMSDLHGCYDKFLEILKLIDFKDTDELYILGDVIDRGVKPLEIIEYIMTHKNITLIKGNHEKMFEEFQETDDTLWFYNGGMTTQNALIIKDFEFDYSEQLYKWIKKLPLYKIVDNNILVHAGLYLPSDYKQYSVEELMVMQEEDTLLWTRDNIGKEREIEGYNIIVGHTLVQTIAKDGDIKILKQNGTIYIDCGCVFEKANGKLACLRLDDMKEFYV